jgi:hypothetical protein
MKAWVKIVDSILHHHKLISKMRFTCLLYTSQHIFYASLCTFLWKMWRITWMLSMTSCFTIHVIFLWPLILDANIKCSLVGQLLIVLWGKWYHLTFFYPQHPLYPSSYMSQIQNDINTRVSSSMATCCSLYTLSSYRHKHGVYWPTHTCDIYRLGNTLDFN